MKVSADVTTILVAFLQQFWLALWALVLLFFLVFSICVGVFVGGPGVRVVEVGSVVV